MSKLDINYLMSWKIFINFFISLNNKSIKRNKHFNEIDNFTISKNI